MSVETKAAAPSLRPAIGFMPYRLALAGGWIDQPFVSKLDPSPPGSMVVIALEPVAWMMERAGMATGTRKIALDLWKDRLPDADPETLVRELYWAENRGRGEPSGSQDMIGLLYPGVCRLDYDASYEGGRFPARIEQNCDPETARWLERVLHLIPVNQRPDGYNPLGVKRLDPGWIRRLGQSGWDCFAAITAHDTAALGQSMNECMRCWEALLPHTVEHPLLTVDLRGLLAAYQARYAGAMYSGCGGGYLIVASEAPVPGAIGLSVRTGGAV